MAIVEYPNGAAFPGVIGRTTDESSPAWPAPVRAGKGKPNVLFVVLDDTGYGNLGCYGSPIATPTFDRWRLRVRLTNMHTTALCSPSRSCIVTGRNHHSNGMACITEFATGYPGYNGVIPFENGMLLGDARRRGLQHVHGRQVAPVAERHRDGGRALRPLAARPRFRALLRLPRRRHQPVVSRVGLRQPPGRARPATPEEGYHLTPDLVDKSITFIADAKQVAPQKPFYLHLCFGATHAPHHVPKEWADRYAGMFDDGWDAYREKVFARQQELGIVPAGTELSRHDPDVPDWNRNLPEARKLYSRMMEVFAGFLSHTDHHLGRPLDYLRAEGLLDNTIVMVISDNGASAEGGPTGTHERGAVLQQRSGAARGEPQGPRRDRRPQALQPLPPGAGPGPATPHSGAGRRETDRGGACDPFIVSWPAGIKATGEVRNQYAHIIDMVPTVLDLLGLEPPATIRGVTQSPSRA